MARAAHVLTRRATPPSLVGVRVGIWVSHFRPSRVVGAGGFPGDSLGLPLMSEHLSPQAARHLTPHLINLRRLQALD